MRRLFFSPRLFQFLLNLTESFALEKFLSWNNAGEMFNLYIKLQYGLTRVNNINSGLTQTGFALVSQESTVPEKKNHAKTPKSMTNNHCAR